MSFHALGFLFDPFAQFSTKTAEADTSSELAKKSKEVFRKEVSFTFSWVFYQIIIAVAHVCPARLTFQFLLLISFQMSQFIVQCLNPYRKPDCKLGRISNTEDFKHLARKVTCVPYAF